MGWVGWGGDGLVKFFVVLREKVLRGFFLLGDFLREFF
jgi:hypothetical protein